MLMGPGGGTGTRHSWEIICMSDCLISFPDRFKIGKKLNEEKKQRNFMRQNLGVREHGKIKIWYK